MNNNVLIEMDRLEALIRDSEKLDAVTSIAWSDEYRAIDTIRLLCGKENIPCEEKKE